MLATLYGHDFSSFSCFLLINLYFLIPAVIAQILIPTAKLVIPTGTPADEENPEIEAQPLTAEMKRKKYVQSDF